MYYSPLRYPGGKGKLASFMKTIIENTGHKGGIYIEPFAGGAGIALDLLLNNTVSENSNYFNRVIFLIDGDARYKDSSQKPKVRDYLSVPFNGNGINERKHNPNICFLPNFFAPESYLYRIINELVCHENDHTVFWRTLDQKEETALYTATKVREMFSGLPDNFNNDDLKCIFGEYHPEKNEQVHNYKARLELIKKGGILFSLICVRGS